MTGEYPFDEPGNRASSDIAKIEAILQFAASEARTLSYSELLLQLGFRFSRPKMRALCKTLDAIDRSAALRGEPELAVLVVREGDGLPGQGWWTERADYGGAWTGSDASAYIKNVQSRAFTFWCARLQSAP